MSSSYKGKEVVVTGGLGFIGGNLAIRLVELGARVTIVDSQVPGCGANPFNIAAIAPDVRLLTCDIGDRAQVFPALWKSEVIFNLAGEVSHIHSMRYPERDLQINALAQLRFVQFCAQAAPGVRIVYAGTRQIYGSPKRLPVDEQHPIEPIDFNGVHKFAASMYHLLLSRTGRLDAVVLRLTNTYGPRMALNVPCQGFLPVFFRRLLLGQNIELFGGGRQLRDPLYVDDAVNALLLAGQIRTLPSRIYNVGGPEVLSIGEIARMATQAAGAACPEAREFPDELKPIDIGSYHSDSRRIQRELAWKPAISLAEGLDRTLVFYRSNLAHYLDTLEPNVRCKLSDLELAVRQTSLT